MSLSLTDLLRLRTRDELRDKLLGELASRGFPVTCLLYTSPSPRDS